MMWGNIKNLKRKRSLCQEHVTLMPPHFTASVFTDRHYKHTSCHSHIITHLYCACSLQRCVFSIHLCDRCFKIICWVSPAKKHVRTAVIQYIYPLKSHWDEFPLLHFTFYLTIYLKTIFAVPHFFLCTDPLHIHTSDTLFPQRDH